MSRSSDAAASAAIALVLALAPACAPPPAGPAAAAVGDHPMRWVLPPGWEHLDHGRQHLFRRGETQLSLTNRGATSRDSSLVFAGMDAAALRDYVVGLHSDPGRSEVATHSRRIVHGAGWSEVETWDRVSHLGRSRVAWVVRDGSLLVLAIDRGPYEQAGPGFEALLTSLEFAAADSSAR